MRNAAILMVTIRGLATEVVKNIVLAGVGKLIIADNEDVKEEDLGTGFFFRDEDVGRKVRLILSALPPPDSFAPGSPDCLRSFVRGSTRPNPGWKV